MSLTEDPRSIRTKDMLENALFQLLKNGSDLHDISISKLTKEAKLNRTTFYLHFNHLDDFLAYITERIIIELDKKFEVLILELSSNRENQLQQLLIYLQQQSVQLLHILKSDQLEHILFQFMKDVIVERRSNANHLSNRSLVDADIKTASIVGIIMWWLKTTVTPSLNAQYIAKQIHLMYRA